MAQFSSMEDLFKCEDLLIELNNAQNADELKMIFDRFGITLEDGITYQDAYNDLLRGKQDGLPEELNEQDLENVNGGFALSSLAIGAAVVIIGTAVIYLLGRYAGSKIYKMSHGG